MPIGPPPFSRLGIFAYPQRKRCLVDDGQPQSRAITPRPMGDIRHRVALKAVALVAVAASAISAAPGSAVRAEVRTPRALPVPAAAQPLKPLPVAIFGTDDRVAVPSRYAQLAEQIGLFFSNPSRTVCTAFCVAPNVIATAAHCLTQPGGKPARLTEFMFARGYDRQREFTRIDGFATGSTAQSLISGEFQHRVKPPIDAAHDWALLRLDRNACPGRGLALEPMSFEAFAAAAKAKQVFQLSYHRDWTQWRLAYSTPCQIGRDFSGANWSSIAPDFLDAEHMILHLCDTGGASSGSPILVEDGSGGVRVAAINVGTYVQSKILSEQGQATLRERAEIIANTAISASVFNHLVGPLSTADLLVSGLEIRTLQQQLAGRNLYTSRIDGSYGPNLRSAIETYERANRLPVTGLATNSLLRRLGAERTGGLGTVAPTSAPQLAPPSRGR